MTARDLLAAALRRWYVVVLGAALTVGAFAVVQRQAPVFFTQYNIVLVGPQGVRDGSLLDNPLYGLQPMAGVVANDINAGHGPLLTGDVAATIVGMGQRDGVQVRVPNLGTQWRPAFPAHHLDVQVAGPDAKTVQDAARETVNRVEQVLAERQDERAVHPQLRVHAVPSSADPIVYPVAGSRSRALGATGLTGIALTAVAVFWLERRRPRRRAAEGPASVPARRRLARRRTRSVEVLA
ncbi:hypothetical protein ACNKF0_17725 [Nocardioides sp. T5]|uniref:hypothetical protein n=1 Tax=Nocardioides sp. T5 TaxID=3400182 RepID=UPI003A8662A1